ncbi:MAG: SDR family oxidoreductase [Clostridia bacterium]|nr:SDR family oxidoreductase [Clostridia bacterium]
MNIVISGTGRGIGKAIAERFLAAGDAVFGFDMRGSAIEHPSYRHFVFDITRDEPIEPVDAHIIINCAGTLEGDEAIEVNLCGNIRFTELFKDSTSLSSVLFIASASARNGAEFPFYVASKAGIVGYMKNLALALSKRGITVNSISPGGVITESNAHILESERLYRAVLDETLLDKWAEPEEIAELAYYMTKVNRSITGEDILIDNGEMLKSNFIW